MTLGRSLERWDGGTKRRNRPDRSTLWVPGKVPAGPDTTGPTVSEASLANYDGSFTNMAPGEVISGLSIRYGFTATASGVTLRQSRIRNEVRPTHVPSVAGETPRVMLAVNALQAGVTGVVIEDVAIDVAPEHQTFDTYGIQGRNLTVRRTEVAGVVDGMVLHGNTTTRGYAYVHGCWVHGLTHFDYDPRQTDGSHDDAIQVQGALEVFEAIGNTLRGGYTSAILITQDVAHPDDYGRVTITDNDLDLERFGGAVVNLAEKGRGVVANYTLARNRFGRLAYDLGRPLILTDSATKAASSTYMPTTGPDANVFADTGQPVPLGFI